MFATRVFLLLIGVYVFNRIIEAQECADRNLVLAAAEGRQCDRPCRPDGSCKKVNRECLCDGFCGWSCKKKYCTVPSVPENGGFSVDPLLGYIGAVLTYNCNEGYRLNGNINRTCLPDKIWDGSDPTCVLRICARLDGPDHGRVSYSVAQRGPGTSATYQCDEGYFVSGDQSRTCQSDGTWTGSDPTCMEGAECPRQHTEVYRQSRQCMRPCLNPGDCTRDRTCVCDDICGLSCIRIDRAGHCPDITGIRGVTVTIDPPSRKFRSTATMSCDRDFEPADGSDDRDRTVKCLGSGHWSEDLLDCIPIARCDAPPDVTHATVTNSRPYYEGNDVATYVCNPGYYRSGQRGEIRCEADRRGSLAWSEQLFNCLPISCGDPGHIPHGRRVGTSFVFQSSVRYECDRGYHIPRRDIRYCQSNQEWSGIVPVCEVVTCPRLVAPGPPIVMTGSGNEYDDLVSFRCNVPLIVNGSSQLRCQEDGTWDGNIPTCRVIRCPPPDVPVNGGITPMADGYAFGTEVEFTCDLTLIGNERTTCNANEEWDLESPICVQTCDVPRSPANGGWSSGIRTGDNIVHGSSLRYYCNRNYFKCHTTEPVCDSGQWRPAATNLCLQYGCAPPNNVDHGSITYTHGELDCSNPDYQPQDTTATFSCGRGYKVPAGVRRQYVCGKYRDRYYRWQTRWQPGWQARCEKKYCLREDLGEHIQASYTLNGISTRSLEQGATAFMTCEDGYNMAGERTSVCDDGTWNNTETTCIPRSCMEDRLHVGPWDPIYNIDRDAEVPPQRPHGTRVTFSCTEHGYQTSDEVICHLGEWEGDPPRCQKIRCQHDGTARGILRVSYEPSNRPPEHGTRRRFSCRINGYEIVGSETSTCNSGVWSGHVPRCSEEPCSENDIGSGDWTASYSMAAVSRNPKRRPHGTLVTFTCTTNGYRTSDVGMCSLGTWNRTLPVCSPVPCVKESVDNAGVTYIPEIPHGSNPVHGTERMYSCNEGYDISDNRSSRCDDGSWSVGKPQCNEKGCEAEVLLELYWSAYSLQGDIRQNIQFGASLPGTIATISCFYGYSLPQDIQNTVTCSLGSWGPLPTCEPVECPVQEIDNVSFVYLRNGQVIDSPRHGDNRTALCKDGYALTGPGKSDCDNGEWIGDHFQCDELGCEYLTVVPEYLTVSYSTTGLDGNGLLPPMTAAEFTCKDPLSRPSRGTRRCKEGRWKKQNPTCDLVTCDTPLSDNNTAYTRFSLYSVYNSSVIGDVLRISCNRGYTPEEPHNFTCGENGFWDPPLMNCSRITCEAKRTIENGEVRQYNDTNHTISSIPVLGDKIRFSCNDGYERQGHRELICGSDGLWDLQYPSCRPKRCRQVGNETVHRIFYNDTSSVQPDYPHGTRVAVRCHNTSFYLSHTEPSTCQHGVWTPEVPECILYSTCLHIEDQVEREVTSPVRQEYSHGVGITIRCSQDRVLDGADRSTCNDGSWDPPLGSCVESEPCPLLDEPSADVWYLGDSPRAFGSNLRIECTGGKTLHGNAISSCQNGTWTPTPGTCADNVALLKDTAQSSIDYDGFPRLAVDGRTNTQFNERSCSHTDPDDAGIHWWYVDLGSVYTVREIRIYNREDTEAIQQRLIGSNVRVGSNTDGAVVGNALVTTVTHHDIETNPLVIKVDPSIEGRIVSINNNGILNFCEVQVFGDDTDRSCRYGCIIPMGHSVSYYRYQYSRAAQDRLFEGDCFTLTHLYLQCDEGLELVQPQRNYYSCYHGVWNTQRNPLNTLANCSVCAGGCVIPNLENGHYTRLGGREAPTGACVRPTERDQYIYVQCTHGDNHRRGSLHVHRCEDGIFSRNTDGNMSSCGVPTCRLPQDTGPVLRFTSLGSPASIDHQFYEGDSITSRCSDPRIQRFSGSRVRQCSGGRWDTGTAGCDLSPVKIEVGNTVLQEVAPNGAIVVSTVSRTVSINCRDEGDRVRRRPDLRGDSGYAYPVVGETAISRMWVSSVSPRNATFTCQPWNTIQQHSIDVIFKDIRCPSPPRDNHGRFDHTKAKVNTFTWDVYLVHETVTLQCEYGYHPSVAGASTCNYEGKWTPPLPTCVRTVS